MPDVISASEADLYLKVGALFVTYFAIETLGYVHGLAEPRAKADALQSVRDGMDHLLHIFRPWDKVAWPASPFLCAILLGYAPFLPKFIAHSLPTTWSSSATHLAVCVTLAVSVTTIGAAVLGPERAARLVHKWSAKCPAALSPLYCVLLALLFFIAFVRIPEITPCKELRTSPWPQFLGAVFTGWLMFITYVGSRFDGALDRLNQVSSGPTERT